MRQPDLWRINGALLAFIDRLLSEIDPDATNAAQAIRRRPPPASAGATLSRLMVSAFDRWVGRRRPVRWVGRARPVRRHPD
jgi:hypothetical protein